MTYAPTSGAASRSYGGISSRPHRRTYAVTRSEPGCAVGPDFARPKTPPTLPRCSRRWAAVGGIAARRSEPPPPGLGMANRSRERQRRWTRGSIRSVIRQARSGVLTHDAGRVPVVMVSQPNSGFLDRRGRGNYRDRRHPLAPLCSSARCSLYLWGTILLSRLPDGRGTADAGREIEQLGGKPIEIGENFGGRDDVGVFGVHVAEAEGVARLAAVEAALFR
jgi:hypothetical protein